MNEEKSPMQIYRSPDGKISLEVQLEKETIWLSQKMMAELFSVEVATINHHISKIYKSLELSQDGTIRKLLIVQNEGGRQINREIDHYNLDMIISIGYRVNSQKATHFRQRATNVLKQYLVQGFALNNSRLRQTGFAELQRAQKYKAFHREQKDWKMRV